MKILSYNINQSTQEKINIILQFNADVYILPEIACPSKVKIPEGYEMDWMGNYDFKGLGVIWKSEMKADIPQWYNPSHQYFLPITIENKLIMAAWPTRSDENAPKDYPQIAMEALHEYAPYLKEFPSVISGDMNCYKGQAGETKRYSIENLFRFLGGMGFVSVYHQRSGELIGKESRATYYHRFNENSPFFLDYTFSNMAIKSYALCEWDKEISDHVAQMIEL